MAYLSSTDLPDTDTDILQRTVHSVQHTIHSSLLLLVVFRHLIIHTHTHTHTHFFMHTHTRTYMRKYTLMCNLGGRRRINPCTRSQCHACAIIQCTANRIQCSGILHLCSRVVSDDVGRVEEARVTACLQMGYGPIRGIRIRKVRHLSICIIH